MRDRSIADAKEKPNVFSREASGKEERAREYDLLLRRTADFGVNFRIFKVRPFAPDCSRDSVIHVVSLGIKPGVSGFQQFRTRS